MYMKCLIMADMYVLYTLSHIFPLYSAKGYSVPKAFIAAQAPMSHTKGDFWKLVWQFRTPTIVLLTNFTEGRQVRVTLHYATLQGQTRWY